MPTFPSTLPLPMLERQYQLEPRTDKVRFESGRVRTRRRQEKPYTILSVRWVFTADQFEEFEEFYRSTLKNGTEDLFIELRRFDSLDFYNTRFLQPKNLKVSGDDSTFKVQAQLFIVPLPTPPEGCPTTAAETFETYGATDEAHGRFYDAGCGWASNWWIRIYPPAIIAVETWEDESDTSNAESATLDGGFGWGIVDDSLGLASWDITAYGFPSVKAVETWEDESDTSNAESATLDGGSGWSTATGEDEWEITAYALPGGQAIETWESYSTSTAAELATLNGGSGWSTDTGADEWNINLR